MHTVAPSKKEGPGKKRVYTEATSKFLSLEFMNLKMCMAWIALIEIAHHMTYIKLLWL